MADDEEIRIGGEEPRREKFKEASKLPDEPKSDITILTESGMRLRERVRKLLGPHGVSLIFTYTRLGAGGEVEAGPSGEPIISDPHEVIISAEDLGRGGQDSMAEGLKQGREVAVARAADFFAGLDALPDALAAILTDRV